MAYNNGFPVIYPQMYYPQYAQMPQAQQMPMQQPQQPQPVQQQIQNGGFLQVRTEDEAYNWPIAPGVGMTFKVENAPIIIDKSRGFSPLDQPVVKVYEMIERAQPRAAYQAAQEATTTPGASYADRSDVEALQKEIEGFRADLEALKNQPIVAEIKRTTTKKKEADE